MITLESTNESIIKEFFNDIHDAYRDFEKKEGGVKKHEKIMNALMEESKRDKKDIFGEVHEFNSKRGNRWRIFNSVRYFEDIDMAVPQTISFAYYETYGSCGAFIYMKTEGSRNKKVIIFTSHFFLRLCQRLGIEYRSSAMIKSFVEIIPSVVIKEKNTFRSGHREVSVALPASIGNGIVRYDSEKHTIIEIRSFLKVTELSKKQRKEADAILNTQKQLGYEPLAVNLVRNLNKVKEKGLEEGLKDINKEIINKMVALGHREDVVRRALSYERVAMSVVADQYNISMDTAIDVFLERAEVAQESYNSACRNIIKPEEWMNGFLEVLHLAEKYCMVYTGKTLDIDKASHSIYELLDMEYEDWDVEYWLEDYKEKIKEYDKRYAINGL